jgi:hypothetical protein
MLGSVCVSVNFGLRSVKAPVRTERRQNPDSSRLTGYLRPDLAFFGAAFLEGVGFFAADFAPLRFPPNAFSQPSEYF